MAGAGPLWSIFVQYPNRDQVLRELPPPQSLSELRDALEVFHDQHLLVCDRQAKGQYVLLERAEQLYDGASLRVTVPRRRIFVSLRGCTRSRPVAWYPGASAEQIETAIAKACGLPVGTPIELLDGDVAVVISATIPNDSMLTAVPLTPYGGVDSVPAVQANGSTPRSPSYDGLQRAGGEAPVQQLQRPPRSGLDSPTRGRGGSTPPAPVGSAGSVSARGTRQASTPQHGGGSNVNLPQRAESSGGYPGSRQGSRQSPNREASPQGLSSSGGGSANLAPGGSGSVDLAAQPTGRVSAPDEHCVHILAGHAGFVLSLCTVGDVLFTGSQDCNIMIWDLNNLQYIGTLPGHRGFVKCMTATLGRKMLCSGSQDKTIKVWSLETFSSTKTLHGHTSEVNALTLLEGGGQDVLVSGSEDKTIRVWDLSSLVLISCLEQAHGSSVFALAPLDDGAMFLSASRDRTIKVWLASTWQARRTLSPPHYDGVSDVAVGANQGRFFSASRDRSIRRWDARTFESDLQLTHAHGDWISSLALAPSENLLFSGSRDCVVKVWDADLHCKDLLLGHRGAISALCTIDGHLLSASHDRTVRVWRVGQYE
eukprot:TRINITY_DN42225_c0_g1_i5.p1 TRINITY_DN42225_c0_g1~~TRINITY_DN42225_c0_g1_i5.p1  ORF type:complete len:595 (+),score=108.88 TRINITY_DN42225_c0_g1_i5:318-2102(+)